MDCERCVSSFQKPLKLPRILTKCGHSYCEECIEELLNNSKVKCPACGLVSTADAADSFPINQSLIAFAGTSEDLCNLHGKRFEAYCTNDKEVLCVNCLLESTHRHHEVANIQIAAGNEREHLKRLELSVMQIEEKLLNAQEQLEQSLRTIGDKFQSAKDQLSGLFKSIREAVDSRENEVMMQLKQSTETELKQITEAQKSNKNQMSAINLLKQEIYLSQTEKDLEVLKKASERGECISSACSGIAEYKSQSPFYSFSKETEIQNVIKLLRSISSANYPKKRNPIELNKEPLPTSSTVTYAAENAQVSKTRYIPSSSSYPFNPHSKIKSKMQSVKITTSRTKDVKSPTQASFPAKPSIYKYNTFSESSKEDDLSSMKSVDLASLCRAPSAFIYTIGGYSESTLSTVETYDCEGQIWKQGAEPSCSRTQFACVQDSSSILVIGGKIVIFT